ncbi:MAG: hypothetical protein QOE75_1911 [Solirubrobacterales bacterium]|nr:hypothetical protein [Solirubrobacterales bacterium]
MSKLLLWLSGADEDVLRHCPRERPKFVAMGGTVVTTSVLALVSSTFVVHDYLHAPFLVALLIGIGWGLAIMNLDRWLLISIRRQDSAWKTIGMALPRVFLAFLIGVVIAIPIELRVFEPEVTAQAEIDKSVALAAGQAQLREQFASIPDLQQRKLDLQAALTEVNSGASLVESPEYQQAQQRQEELEVRASEARREATCERDGTCGTGKSGPGSVYAEKDQIATGLEEEAAAQQREVEAIGGRLRAAEGASAGQARSFSRGELIKVRNQLRELRDERGKQNQELVGVFEEPIGLLNRIEALNNLASQHAVLEGVRILLFLFILAIDVMPALAKMLMSLGKRSLYESVQESLEEADADAIKQQVSARLAANEISASIAVNDETARKRAVEEVQEGLLRKTVGVMREAGEAFIARWRIAVLNDVDRQVAVELRRNGLTPPDDDDAGGGDEGDEGDEPPLGNGARRRS